MSNYLHLFASESARTTYEGGNSYEEPYVSLVGEDSVHFNKPYKAIVTHSGGVSKIYGSGILSSSDISSYSNITNVTISNNVTSIGWAAFAGCTGLTSINIPNSVTSIGEHVFAYCSGLTSVIIGKSVTSIGEYAFDECENLNSITLLSTVPIALGSSAFRNNASGRKIYVPSESVNAYKTASDWSIYASDIEAIS